MRIATVVAVLAVLLGVGPTALADHGDPTHGTLPHSVGDSPTNIHPVDVSTPHPYPQNEVFTYELRVDGADSLAIHFERYAVDGFYSTFSQQCFGGLIRILDGATALELEAICGDRFLGSGERAGSNDFWTPDYPTDHLVLEFSTGQSFSESYGFDVYEIASNGARPIVSVPYSAEATAYADPRADYTVDPFDPRRSAASAYAGLGAAYGDTSGRVDAGADYGRFFVCGGFICMEREGARVRAGAELNALDHWLLLQLQIFMPRDDSSPTGLGEPELGGACVIDGDDCL